MTPEEDRVRTDHACYAALLHAINAGVARDDGIIHEPAGFDLDRDTGRCRCPICRPIASPD